MLEINSSYIKNNFHNIEWEVITSTSSNSSVSMDNRGLGTPTNNSATSVIVRVVLPDKRNGFFIDTNPLNWKQAFKQAYKIAKVSKKREVCPPISSKLISSKKVNIFKNFNEEELFNKLELMKNEIDNKATLINAGVSKSIDQTKYYNSNSSEILIKKSSIGGALSIGENYRLGYASSSNSLNIPDFTKIVREALQQYNWSKNLVNVKGGDYDVLFFPDALRTVLIPIMFSLLGNNIVEKQSNYIDKIGEQVLSEKFTLVDNPLHKNNESLFDFEGNKTQITKVIENGVIKSFLHDNYTSSVLKMNNTHNSSSIIVKPSVSFFNPEIKGEDKLNEMISTIKKGFLFYDLYPTHVVNNITGMFGLNSSTFFYIENGEIKGLKKGGVVTGNSFEMFKNIQAISKETRYDLGNFNLPSIKTKAKII